MTRPCASLITASVLLAAFVTGCQAPDAPSNDTSTTPQPSVDAGEARPDDSTDAVSPTDEFLAGVQALCGQAFSGRIVADTPAPAADDPFAGKPLVMHVRDCTGNEVRIPFHVGDDRSRTWVLTRTEHGLRLKHDHRHEDGSADVLTMYGGDTVDPGSAMRQEFPVDDESRALFSREGREVSNSNVWAMEIDPGAMFAYELSRPQRLFRVEFDLSQPVALPPPAWGHEQ